MDEDALLSFYSSSVYFDDNISFYLANRSRLPRLHLTDQREILTELFTWALGAGPALLGEQIQISG